MLSLRLLVNRYLDDQSLAPIAAASFFGVAGKCWFGIPNVIRNAEKDTAESGKKLLYKNICIKKPQKVLRFCLSMIQLSNYLTCLIDSLLPLSWQI